MLLPSLAVLALVAANAARQPEPQTIWIEGEDATVDRMNRHPWWYDKVDTSELSGGAWISNFKTGQRGMAEYRFESPGGRTRFLLRANPANNQLQYRLNRGEWSDVPFDRATDRRNIAADGKPDLRFIAWVDLGEVELARGENRLAFRTNTPNLPDHHGAIDAIVFTTDAAYEPIGTRKPGEAAPAERGGSDETWAFRPPLDRLDAGALLDLRPLNEEVAGEAGFVRLSDDGNGFVRGDGDPIRFWAVNDYAFRDLDVEALEAHAHFLAKRGVNMARWHGQLPDMSPGAKLGDVNDQALDELHKYVAAFKNAGIYLTISPYYPHAAGRRGEKNGFPQSWEVPADTTQMTGLVYFVPEVQAGYKRWLKEMMTRENPYTGVALKDDPAVAIVQMQNEDSLLFWTMANIEGEAAKLLAERFGDFLSNKYGSLDAAKQALGDSKPQGPLGEVADDWEKGVVAISNVWNMTQPRSQNAAFARRIDDQTQFLTTLMRDWHAEVARYLEDDLGAGQLFNAGNWRTADNLLLDDHERYAYAIDGAVIGLNRYTTSRHEGQHQGWAITEGDIYANESVLKNPGKLQVSVKQPEGHPYIFPECLWVPPMWYQAEGPWLTAAYGSLGGTDIHYWFANNEPQWRQPGSANGYLPSVGKWVLATPGHLGMFPAASLIFRRGYLDEGEPVVIEHRPPSELWERAAPLISFDGAYDPNRDDIAPAGSNAGGRRVAVPREAFLVGPVRVRFDEGQDMVADIAAHVAGNVVTSNTGQLRWDTEAGVAEMRAPKAQGAVGFLGGRTIELPDVTIVYEPGDVSDSELADRTGYAAISVVPLDDEPIGLSRKLLVQVGTVARPTGWLVTQAEDADDADNAYRVEAFGNAPWQVEKASNLTVSIANPDLSKATVLDPNGMPLGEAKVSRDGGHLVLTCPEDALYVIVE